MYLLDTNVISELRKVRSGKANPNVAAWAGSVDTEQLHVSVITIEELEIGVLKAEHNDAAKGAILRTWLDNQVLPAFSDRILPVNAAIALRSASLHVPNLKPVRDGLIAATAIVHGMSVVTRNVSDFAPMAKTINPWNHKI